MARVTVEDCIEKVPNRFDLILLAAQRGRDIAGGASILVPRDEDKNPVLALREIADADLDLDGLQASVINNLQRYRDRDEPELLDDDEAFETSMVEGGEFDNALSEEDILKASKDEDDQDDAMDAMLDDLNDELLGGDDASADGDSKMDGAQFDDVDPDGDEA